MTNENKPPRLPAFYIFEESESGLVPVGRAFKHQRGNGINILVDGKRFVAFLPKPKIEMPAAAE